jgi:hypothetical protein
MYYVVKYDVAGEYQKHRNMQYIDSPHVFLHVVSAVISVKAALRAIRLNVDDS